jgi:YidC/Oxa1 family membrane protein insertase
MRFLNALKSWRGAKAFQRLPSAKRQLVFYAESRDYKKYFWPVLEELLRRKNNGICYLTSDPEDPLLSIKHSGLHVFYVGSGSARIYLFSVLPSCVLVMTLPDLNSFHIKRSINNVHYCYLHHSMVSTHMIYRTHAFDSFDSVLCVGPHHINETRAHEQVNELPSKRLFQHGYGPLDTLISLAKSRTSDANIHGQHHVLIAPSWGNDTLVESNARPIVEQLLNAGYRVTVRPHPRTLLIAPQTALSLEAHFSNDPNFALDSDSSSLDVLLNAHIMISDWSGVAMEFAFGLERPVLFIDVPRKILNSEYAELGLSPLEVEYRHEVGQVLPVDQLGQVVQVINTLITCTTDYADNIRQIRNKWVFNIANSGAKGADCLLELLQDRESI